MDINEDLKELNLLLQKIYSKTKCNKFMDDIVYLEQWLWTLSDDNKKKLNITINGSYDAEKIKNNVLLNDKPN